MIGKYINDNYLLLSRCASLRRIMLLEITIENQDKNDCHPLIIRHHEEDMQCVRVYVDESHVTVNIEELRLALRKINTK
jgi:hypothetical protein